jgi:hypothetical protein
MAFKTRCAALIAALLALTQVALADITVRGPRYSGGGRVVITAIASAGYAVGALYWAGKQFIDTHDAGRFGPMLSVHLGLGTAHPEEYDPSGGSKGYFTQVLDAVKTAANSFTVTYKPTNYYAGGTSTEVTATSTFTVGWHGFANVIDCQFSVTLTNPRPGVRYIEAPSIYLKADLNKFDAYNAMRGKVKAIPSGADTNYPVIAYNAAGIAIGIIGYTGSNWGDSVKGFGSVNKLNRKFGMTGRTSITVDTKVVVGRLPQVMKTMRQMAHIQGGQGIGTKHAAAHAAGGAKGGRK